MHRTPQRRPVSNPIAMMLPTEEFLCGNGISPERPATPLRWVRPAVQWLAVGLAHATMIGCVVQLSPPAQYMLETVIQASLIAPQPMAKPSPPTKQIPKPAKAPRPPPALLAAVYEEPLSSTFVAPTAPTEPTLIAPAPPAPTVAPAPLIPPLFNADYLENPPPAYPLSSRRLGEKGRVLLRVFVSANGRAERVEIQTSSGFERLDSAARDAVTHWRFVPARRGDEHVAAWVLVPVSFVM